MKFLVWVSLLVGSGAVQYCPNGSPMPPVHLQFVHAHDLFSFVLTDWRDSYMEGMPKVFDELNKRFGPSTESAIVSFQNKVGYDVDVDLWCYRLDMPLGHLNHEDVYNKWKELRAKVYNYDYGYSSSSDVMYKLLRSKDIPWILEDVDSDNVTMVRVISIASDKKSRLEPVYNDFPTINYQAGGVEDCDVYEYPSINDLRQAAYNGPNVTFVFHVTPTRYPDMKEWYETTVHDDWLAGAVNVVAANINSDPANELLEMIVRQVELAVCRSDVPPPTCEEKLDSLIDLLTAS